MLLGYLHADHTQSAQMQRLIEALAQQLKGAIDELSLGTIRDSFSNQLFPGTSTLQTHLKYFSLLPQLYMHAATTGSYKRLEEVRAEIRRLEVLMTKSLVESSPRGTKGIIGSDNYQRGPRHYVKYDPDYIYRAGINRWGILREGRIVEWIFEYARQRAAIPKPLKGKDAEIADDMEQDTGLKQMLLTPATKEYHFDGSACSLQLTTADKEFITNRILSTTQGTLLHFLVSNVDNLAELLSPEFPGIDPSELPQALAALQARASEFADFASVLYKRYNWLFSGQTDQQKLEEFLQEAENYRLREIDLEAVLQAARDGDHRAKSFCLEAEKYLVSGDYDALDKHIIRREKQVKGPRHKIDNPNYDYSEVGPVQPRKMSFRWATVYTFLQELKNGGE